MWRIRIRRRRRRSSSRRGGGRRSSNRSRLVFLPTLICKLSNFLLHCRNVLISNPNYTDDDSSHDEIRTSDESDARMMMKAPLIAKSSSSSSSLSSPLSSSSSSSSSSVLVSSSLLAKLRWIHKNHRRTASLVHMSYCSLPPPFMLFNFPYRLN